MGIIIDSEDVAIDLGGTANNDEFEDILFVPAIAKVAVLTTSFKLAPQNLDFGIAILNVNPNDGSLILDTGFDGNGKSSCTFDHGVNGVDFADSIIWNKSSQTFIFGGSAFEGNGFNNLGQNLAFCEFNLQGPFIDNQWSTQGVTDNLFNIELVRGMALSSGLLNQFLIVGASKSTPTNQSTFGLTRYVNDIFTGNWQLDTSFGTDGDGWIEIDFNSYFQNNSSFAFPTSMVQDANGNIILAGLSENTDNAQNLTKYLAMVKFKSDGILDTKWGDTSHKGQSMLQFPNMSGFDQINDIALDSTNNEVYISGISRVSNAPSMPSYSFVAKINNSDTIFENGFEN